MRKLATAALSFTAAVIIAQYFLRHEWLAACSAGLAALLLPGLLMKGDAGLRLRIISLAAAFGLLWSWAHELLFIQSGESYAGTSATVQARVLDFPITHDDYSSVSIKLTGEAVPNLKTTLYNFDGNLPELEPGDMITADLSFKSASKRYDEETGRYTSMGVYLLAYLDGGIEVTGKWQFSFLHFPQYVNVAIKNTLAEIFPEDVLGFQTALLTGDKSLLYEDRELNNAMGTAGIMHVVAISGMHVAFLVGMVRTLTRRRRITAMICIPLILLFIPMTGGSPSVVRAGAMQIMLLAAPLLRRENDSITSLSLVLALLLLANPASIQSAGLQLSFAAMAGIILVTPVVNGALSEKAGKLLERKLLGPVTRFVISSFSSTVGALVLSTPLVAWQFGYVSLVSPLANMLVLPVVSLCFSLGYLCCLSGMLLPALGTAMAWVLAWLIRYILFVAKLLGSIPFAALYTSNPLISIWLALTYIYFAVCWFFRGERGFRIPVPLALSLCTLAAALLTTSITNALPAGTITVMDVGQGQSVVITSGPSTVVVDCGGEGSGTAGTLTTNYLLGQNILSVDALVLTHLHQDHADGAAELLSRLRVGRLILPAGGPDDDGLLNEILDMAQRRGTEVVFLDSHMTGQSGSLSLTFYAPVGSSGMNERGIVIAAAVGEFDMLITGDINAFTERLLMSKTALPDVELLVVGHHGSRYSTGEELLDTVKPEYAAISVGNNSYGHPTDEVLLRLSDAGAAIFRTDLSGSIVFSVK